MIILAAGQQDGVWHNMRYLNQVQEQWNDVGPIPKVLVETLVCSFLAVLYSIAKKIILFCLIVALFALAAYVLYLLAIYLYRTYG